MIVFQLSPALAYVGVAAIAITVLIVAFVAVADQHITDGAWEERPLFLPLGELWRTRIQPQLTYPDPGPLIALCCVSLTLTGVALRHYITRADEIDFRTFYTEGRALLDGVALYTVEQGRWNFNSPALTAWVFAPLALLPYDATISVWFCLSVAAFVGGLRTIARELALSPDQTIGLAALILLTHGSFQAWAIGQLTFPLLFYPMTQAWLAYRRGELTRCGLWLAPAIVAKPPLALTALLLPMPVWLVAGSVSAALSGVTVLWTGIAPWKTWLAISGTIDWLSRTFNASLWGAAARLQVGDGAVTVAQLDVRLLAAVLLVGAALAYTAIIESDRDRRFMRAGLWSTLLSPLGWAYYLPLVAGPVDALWTGSRIAWVAYALLLLPVGMDTGLGILLGSVFCIATLIGWTTLQRRRGQCDRM